MIVGKTGSGKSVSWQILQQVLSTMKKEGVAGYNLVKVFLSIAYDLVFFPLALKFCLNRNIL